MEQEHRLMVLVGYNAVWAFTIDDVITALKEFNELPIDHKYFWNYFGWKYGCEAHGLSAWQNDDSLIEYNRRLSDMKCH